MAIIDTDFMMSQPKGLTSASGIDALTHALEAYVSIMETDFTDGLALTTVKNIFNYLPHGITGKDDKEVLENFIKAIAQLKETVGIKRTIKEYGVKEEDFLATIDEMVENAFNDQCTGANPRYPLMSEMKDMYLKAYYGE